MVDPAAQCILVPVVCQQVGQRLHPLRDRVLGAGHRRVEGEDHPVVPLACGQELVVDRLEARDDVLDRDLQVIGGLLDGVAVLLDGRDDIGDVQSTAST